MRLSLLAGLCALLCLVAGCFETTLSLGTEDDSKVSVAFCGNWEITNPDKPEEKSNLFIRNIDGKRYFERGNPLSSHSSHGAAVAASH
jgi:hypothetical protein